MKLPNLPMRTFYLAASILMGIAILGSFVNIYFVWNNLNLGSRTTTITSLCFNFLLLWLFSSLYRETPNIVLPEDTEIKEAMKQLQG